MSNTNDHSDDRATPTKRRTSRWLIGGIGTAATVLAVVGGIAIAKPAAIELEPVRDVPHLEGSTIHFSAAFAKRVGIEIKPCEAGALAPLIRVTGTVNFDPHRLATVGAPIDGRIHRLLKYPGDAVLEGETVAEIESATLGQVQASLAATRAHAEAASSNERREADLAALHVSSLRDAELAKATAAAARADLAAAEQRIKAFGGSASRALGILPLRSPLVGNVVDLQVSAGQAVAANATVLRVADTSQLWIELAVFERDIGQIRQNDVVDVLLPNGSSAVSAKIAYLGAVVDLETKTVRARVVVENPDNLLRPGQSVIANIHVAPTSAVRPKLALTTITRVDGKEVVFVATSDHSVEPRNVVLGSKDATHAIILSGVEVGERVVMVGAFALKSEIFR